MSAILNEDTQYVSVGGIPLTGGKIFIGLVDQDPVLNPKPIFSDRELTLPLANPQTLDDTGRSTNKIWTDGKHSLQINDIAGVQVFQDLDRGESSTSLGVVGLSSVLGGNIIIASASPVITSYVDKLFYIFTAAQTNTGAVTLDIDGIGPKSIVQNNDLALGSGRIKADDNVIVSFNATNDNFDIVNQKTNLVAYRTTAIGDNIDPQDLGFLIDCTAALTLTITAAATLGNGFSFYVKANGGTVTIDPDGIETIDGFTAKLVPDGTQLLITSDGTNFHTSMSSPIIATGANVVSASALPLLDDGEFNTVTGTTTITSIDSIGVGRTKTLTFSDILILMQNPTQLILITAANIITAAGDKAVMHEFAIGDWEMIDYIRADGTALALIPSPPTVQVFTVSGTYTPTSGAVAASVIVTNGGNGGNTNPNNTGGTAGATSIKMVDLSGIATATITIGAGGIADTIGGVSEYEDGVTTVKGDAGGDIIALGGIAGNNGGGLGFATGGPSFWGGFGQGGTGGGFNGGIGVIHITEFF